MKSELCLILTLMITIEMAASSEVPLPQQFNKISRELVNLLNVTDFDKATVSVLIDELNAFPYDKERFIRRHVASPLITALCDNVKHADDLLTAKTSRLLNNVFSKTSILFTDETASEVILWHNKCLKDSPNAIMAEILSNLDAILKWSSRLIVKPDVVSKFTEELLGSGGTLTKLMEKEKQNTKLVPLMKGVCSNIILVDKQLKQYVLTPEIKESVKKYCSE